MSFVYTHACPRSTHTHIWRTAKLSDKTHKHWIYPHYLRKPDFFFVQNPSIRQLSHTNPTQLTLDRSAIQQQPPTIFSAYIYTTHALPSNRFWVGSQTPQRFIYPFVYQPTYTTVSLTRAHNQANRVSGVDSTSLWRAYPGVLSDTPTECVTQCANIPSLKQTPDTMH